MFLLYRNALNWRTLAKFARSFPIVTSVHRGFNKVKDNNIEGRDRLNVLQGNASYPPFRVSYTLDEFHSRWNHLTNGERYIEEEILVAGRIINMRSAGSKLYFYDIRSGETMLQVMSSLATYSPGVSDADLIKTEFRGIHKKLRTGDVIGIRGIPGRTDLGELSILPKQITLLAPCLWRVPREWHEIKDPEIKYRKRYLDLIVSKHTRDVFYKRSSILKMIRKFMEEEGFLDVETSILSIQAGGAVATPFITRSETQNQDLALRISPELALKELVIGGFERVYEMGKVFRNEGLDSKHNFEFTTIEAYMTYQDYTDWMKKTEVLLYRICQQINQSSSAIIQDTIIDFTPPYRRIDVTDELTKCLGSLPDLNHESSIVRLLELCKEHCIEISRPITLPRILDTLIGHFIEPQCVQPTFIINHPMVMSPLSKEHEHSGKSERFELFIHGTELVNAYTEQNSPLIQEKSFLIQGKQREEGDKEIPPSDLTFIDALEYGLPPTTGWGMGVDRLVMMMTNQSSIRDVVFFPVLKSKQKDEK